MAKEPELPEPTPEGTLIRRVRESLRPRLPVSEAARRADISAETWGNVERGYRTPRRGEHVRVIATASTLAHMAHTVGLRPGDLERLERENATAAAQILKEMYGPELEPLEIKVDRGTVVVPVPVTLSDEDREFVKRQAAETAAMLDRRRRESSNE